MLFWILICAVVVILDQITKWLAVKYLIPIGTLPIIKDALHLTYVENPGAAFGMMKNSRWIFLVISSVGLKGDRLLETLRKGGDLAERVTVVCPKVGNCFKTFCSQKILVYFGKIRMLIAKEGDISAQLIIDDVAEHLDRFHVGEQKLRFAYFVLVLLVKRIMEEVFSANGHVGGVKLTFRSNSVNILQHVGQAGSKRKQYDHILATVLFASLAIGQDPLAVEKMPSNKAVAGKKVADLDAVSLTDIQDLVRAVPHAVHNYSFLCVLKIRPKIVGFCHNCS
ncbi:MAG: signal peptidase II [Clostridia bacterium]|nr:signal peptidase II [Clostridia bacterium]